ncbi:MAG: TVP38/TMEM64 family protein [Planctomycetes bacterium]|nr:TVP38/TMEM64 family protein [Planctomycetota bacterium]
MTPADPPSSHPPTSGPSQVARLLGAALLAALASLFWWSYRTEGVVYVLCQSNLTAAEKIQRLQAFFQQFGPFAPLAYVALVICEVVLAPLPGAMLYAPGGIIFGGFWGGLLSLAGNVLGAGLACQLMRTFGQSYFVRFLDRGALRHYETRLIRSGVGIVFLLRINPLTSSDFVSYAAGLTRMPLWKLMLGTALGMAPLCWAQAYLAGELLTAFPNLIYPLLIACVIYTFCVIVVARRLLKQTALEAEPAD